MITIKRADISKFNSSTLEAYKEDQCTFRAVKGFILTFAVLGLAALVFGILASPNGSLSQFHHFQRMWIGVGASLLVLSVILAVVIRKKEAEAEQTYIDLSNEKELP